MRLAQTHVPRPTRQTYLILRHLSLIHGALRALYPVGKSFDTTRASRWRKVANHTRLWWTTAVPTLDCMGGLGNFPETESTLMPQNLYDGTLSWKCHPSTRQTYSLALL